MNLKKSDILKLFNDGLYSVDLDAGTIISSKTDKPLATFQGNPNNCHGELQEVKLYCDGRRGHFQTSHIIWMVGNQCEIPAGFEIHHRDTNQRNDSFNNLFALHTNDHRKLHNNDLIETDEIPF